MKTHLKCPRARGFALVVTLSLMILLTIIAVGLLTLSSISLRASSQGSAMATARANAQLALMLAIGDLQKNAGPDQRITARAEILDSKPDTPEVDDVKQPYWTSSWITGDLGLDRPNSGMSQRRKSFNKADPQIADKAKSGKWLVSNPKPSAATPLNPLSYAGTTTGTNPEAVVVAKGLGAASLDVAVPLVNIVGSASTQPTGRYGYWVSDEGLKAKVNLVDPTIGVASNSQTGQAHFLAPQANAIHKINGLVADSSEDFRSENMNDLSKTFTSNTMSLLKTSPAGLNLKLFTPDVTTVSSGVLADVKHGGLKKDLTAAFETTAGFDKLANNFGYDKKTVYRNHPDLTVPNSTAMQTEALTYEGITDGLPWAVLHAYYNIYKDMLPRPGSTTMDSTVTPASAGSMASLPYTVTPRVISLKEPATGTAAYGKYGGLVPEIISNRTDIALQSYPEDDTSTTPATRKWKLRLKYCPQLVLYNPYSCRISLQNFQVERRFLSLQNFYITVYVDGKKVANQMQVSQGPINTAQRSPLKVKAGECDTLEPGETRVFGLAKEATFSNPSDAITFNELVSYPDLLPEKGQYCDLRVSTTVKTDGKGHVTEFDNGDPWPGTTNVNAVVDLPLAENPALQRLSAGECDTFMRPNRQWPVTDFSNRDFNVAGPDVAVPSGAKPWSPVAITSMTETAGARILSGFFLRRKGLKPPPTNAKYYFNGNMTIPLFHGNAPFFTPFENMLSVAWEEFFINPFGEAYSNASDVELIKASSRAETYFGGSSVGILDLATPNRIVLRDVPNQPLISIGQFMHMPTMVFGNHNAAMQNYFRFGFRDTGSMFIGGSLANPFIDTSKNLLFWSRGTSDYNPDFFIYDDSFLANDALFDRFYFSTVPPADLNTNAPQLWTDFNNANPDARLKSPTTPLSNSRIKPYYKNGEAPLMSDMRDLDQAAANLMLDGAFNVNSTSINAWRALLSSLSGNDMEVFKSLSGGQGNISSTRLKNPIPRFWSSSNAGNVNTPWEGNRALSDEEVTELATRIVEQVKTRGPFLSMADFLNRRLGNAGPLTLAGCLQAAIDNTDINNSVKSAGALVNATGSGMTLRGFPPLAIPPVIGANMKDGAGKQLNSTVGMPGYLMQQDIVQAFSPAMTVRSDTFVIRTYGESLNSSGQVQAKAWAEAVVQRVPEFVDPTANPDPATSLTSLTSPINQTMGRRFKVVGFRWLSPNEI